MKKHYTSEVSPGKEVVLAGWVHEKRDIGKLVFIILRDREGFAQITAKKGEADDSILELFKKVTKESVISVEGKAVENKAAPNGVEVKPTKAVLVAGAGTPLPMESTGKVESDFDTRIDNRFLDSRRPEVQAVFRIQAQILHSFRASLEELGFIEVQPPSIIASASEGGAELFPIPYYDKEAFLAQSPQLYKQMAISGGFERVFMVTPVWRAEKSHTIRHLSESRQMDIEMGFSTDKEALEVLDKVIERIFSDVADKCKKELGVLKRKISVPKIPLKRLTYTEGLKILAKKGVKTEWGEDFPPEGEKIVCDNHGEDPILITEWPTKVRSFYSMPEPKNPKICRAYDLLYGGMEVLSGAQRIHDAVLLRKKLEEKGMNPDNFKAYLDALTYGCPPHAGWSIGLERLTMTICGLGNIREACLFPRDTKRITP